MAKPEIYAKPTAVLVGDAGVGKTTLFTKYTKGRWPDTHVATIASVYARKELVIDGERVFLSIFDTPGAIRMRDLLVHYFRECAVVMLCLEVGDGNPVEKMRDHLVFIRSHTDVPILLVMTKVDDENDDSRDLSSKDWSERMEIERFAETEELPLILTSSLADLNIEEAFLQAAKLGVKYLSSKGYVVNGVPAIVEIMPKTIKSPYFDLSSWC